MAKEKTTEIDLQELLQELSHNWKPQTCNQYNARMVAYIDARDVQERLDKVCGPQNWQCEFYELKGRIFCKIGIFLNGQWIWKSDCGSESNIEREKGEASDAFKRAAVHWGVGRFLYDLPEVYWRETVEYGKNRKGEPAYRPARNGKVLWDKATINSTCNEMVKAIEVGAVVAEPAPPPESAPAVSPPAKPVPPDDKLQTLVKQTNERLLMLSTNDAALARVKLEEFSSFPGRDGTTVSWKHSLEDFAARQPKWFYRTAAKIKAEVEKQGLGAPVGAQDDKPPQEEIDRQADEYGKEMDDEIPF